MLLAMGIASALCIGIGTFPQPLYNILPFPVDYIPYTGDHVVGQLQLLMFGALAFALLMLSGIYPAEIRAINLDTDWFYRKGGKTFYRFCQWAFDGINDWANRIFAREVPSLLARFFEEPGGNVQKYGYRLWVETSGIDEHQDRITTMVEKRSRNAAYPIGGGVLLAVMILALTSLLLYLK
jgi:multicomponent Na+:H+ antiporter subunit D